MATWLEQQDQQAQQAAADEWAKRYAGLNSILNQQPQYQSYLNTPEFQNVKDFAFGTSDSPETLLQKQASDLNTQRGLEGLSRDQAGQQANAYSQLAMGGGLSSGARERIASGLGSQGLFARQGTRATGATNLSNIDLAQAQQRTQAKGAYLDAQARDTAAQNAAAQNAWQLKAETYAGLQKAQEEAKAQAASGGGGKK